MNIRTNSAFKRTIWWVFAGTRGGINRLRIMVGLLREPMNAHRLSKRLDIDYKTVVHHLTVLRRNGMIVGTGNGYGAMYFPSPEFEAHYVTIRNLIPVIDRVS